MNAYELADEIDSIAKDWLGQNKSGQLANVLRQQADRIAELEKELSWWRTNFKLPTETNEPRPNWLYAPQTKPLSDEEIKQIWYDLYPLSSSSYWDDKREGIAELKFARAIEERHGIK